MKGSKNLLLYFVVLSVFIGCQAKPEPVKIDTTDMPTLVPADTIQAPIATGTPTALAYGNFICPEVITSKSTGNIAGGRLFYVDYNDYKLKVLDLQTMTSKTLIQEGEEMKSYALSPDGEWLVYQSVNVETLKEWLVVTKTRSNEKPIYLPWEKDWDKVVYRLNNEQVIINMYSDRYDRVMALNPISGENQVLIADFPELYFSHQGINWNGAGLVVYNPTLTKAVYAEINHHLVVWDMVEDREIARVDSFPMNTVLHTASPQWTSNGEKVIVLAHVDSSDAFDLFSIDENGTVQKLTNFSGVYPSRYNLSPDGRYVAMLIDVPEKLAVLDTYSHELDVYCIEGDTSIKTIFDYRKNPNGFRDPNIYKAVVWSPNSRQLIIENRYLEDASRIILVDVEKKSAYEILNNVNYQPVGWAGE